MSHYTNLNKIGSGGFGVVYRCERKEDGKLCARKILLQANKDSLKRFQREVRILSNLDHPRIIKVIGKKLNSLQPWYVMPLYEGSLEAYLPGLINDEGRIQHVYGAILEGIQYAHEQGVLHRDLKPANILLNSDEDVVISDFGLGRSLQALTTRATQSGDTFGTPGYAAPEQGANAKLSDERSDIYALGRILYVLYTGANPSAVQDFSMVPPGIALIIDRCTKTDPTNRFQSVTELRLAFENLFAAGDKKTNEGKIKQLIAKALAEGMLNDQDVAALSDYILGCLDDHDFLRDICVNLPGAVFNSLWKHNKHAVRSLVEIFTTQIASQWWSFNYVDTLGDTCIKIFKNIEDPQTRAMVAHAIVKVSVDNNRWKVMDQAAWLLMAANKPEEDLAIAEKLSAVADRLRVLEERLKKGRLGPNVTTLLE